MDKIMRCMILPDVLPPATPYKEGRKMPYKFFRLTGPALFGVCLNRWFVVKVKFLGYDTLKQSCIWCRIFGWN
jgi:hypothetical protein